MNAKPFAYVYACYDPKILDGIYTWCKERFGEANFILAPDPGAAINFVSPKILGTPEIVLSQMDLAHTKVHAPLDMIVLINHSSCGAYADAGATFPDAPTEEARHKNDLEQAKKIVEEKFPGVPVEIHYFLKAEQRFAW